MVEHDCFLLAYHFSAPSNWRENQGSQYPTGTGHTGNETSTFHTGLNTGHVSVIPAHFGQYRPVQKKKKVFLFLFLSFVIFEFLLGQNSNLLVLFVFLVCNGNFLSFLFFILCFFFLFF